MCWRRSRWSRAGSATARCARFSGSEVTDEREDTEMDQPQRHRDTELLIINGVTERIIGCAIEVHRELRAGLFESIYRAALAIEFQSCGIAFKREWRLPAIYKGKPLGNYRVDFIVEDCVVVEVKAVEKMHPVF